MLTAEEVKEICNRAREVFVSQSNIIHLHTPITVRERMKSEHRFAEIFTVSSTIWSNSLKWVGIVPMSTICFWETLWTVGTMAWRQSFWWFCWSFVTLITSPFCVETTRVDRRHRYTVFMRSACESISLPKCGRCWPICLTICPLARWWTTLCSASTADCLLWFRRWIK